MRKSWLIVGAVAFALCFSAGVILSRAGSPISPPPAGSVDAVEDGSAAGADGEPTAERPPVVPKLAPPIGAFRLEGDRYVADLEGGGQATLTLDVALQQHMESLYAKYEVPHAALVAVEPSTGRVLAYVSHESAPAEDRLGDVAGSAFAPSASIFKIITAAALIEDVSAITPTTTTCYHGGTSSLSEGEIVGDPTRDSACVDLATAFGRSTNSVFAKLAYRHLTPDDLEAWAARFGYDQMIPFNFQVEPSLANIPTDKIEMARVAAGFWHTTLSPFHGALLSAAVANGGVLMRPNIVESATDASGKEVYRFSPTPWKYVMKPETARQVADLMVRTTTVGTGERYFSRIEDDLPEDFTPVGKTGTLSRKRPYLQYSWFVGFAPIEAPKIAVGALVGNPLKWRIKGTFAAAEAIRVFQKEAEETAAPPSGGVGGDSEPGAGDGEQAPGDGDAAPAEEAAPAVEEGDAPSPGESALATPPGSAPSDAAVPPRQLTDR